MTNKKILIINFNDSESVVNCSSLASYLKDNNTNISLLTYETSRGQAELMTAVEQIYTVDCELIRKYYQNHFFSDAESINTFWQVIEQINLESWDCIYTFSYNPLTSAIADMINARAVEGWRMEPDRSVSSSIELLQFAQNYMRCQTIRSCELWAAHKILLRNENEFIQNTDLNYKTQQNLKLIHDSLGNIEDLQFVAIDMRNHFQRQKNWVATIQRIFEYENLYPLFLIENSSQQRNFMNNLNRSFQDKLLSIEINDKGLLSLIKNISVVITNDSFCSILAQRNQIKQIFIQDNLNNRGYFNTQDIVIEFDQLASTNDLMFSIDYALNKIYASELQIIENLHHSTVYEMTNSKGFLYSKPLNRSSNNNESLIIANKLWLQQYFISSESLESVEVSNREQIAFAEKVSISDASKHILSAIKALKNSVADRKSQQSFLLYLSNILSFANSDGLVSLPISIFEYKVQNLNSSDRTTNFKMIEEYLYQLKNDLQTLLKFLEEESPKRPMEALF